MISLPFEIGRGPPSVVGTVPQHRKKADAAEHPKVFDHVGLLFNEPPATGELLSI
jgi:hypothetical protein